MKRIAILVCVLVSSVIIQGFNVRYIAKVLNVPEEEIDECMRENYVEDVDIYQLEHSFQMHKGSTEEYMKNISCFITCAFEKSNIVKNNEIQLDTLLEIAERNNFGVSPKTIQKLGECIDVAKGQTDKCDAVVAFIMCCIEEFRRR